MDFNESNSDRQRLDVPAFDFLSRFVSFLNHYDRGFGQDQQKAITLPFNHQATTSKLHSNRIDAMAKAQKQQQGDFCEAGPPTFRLHDDTMLTNNNQLSPTLMTFDKEVNQGRALIEHHLTFHRFR